MFNKIKQLFNKNEPPEASKSVLDEFEVDPDSVEFNIAYTLTTDGNLYIDINASEENFDVLRLASFLSYSSSYKGQLDTLEVLKETMDGEDYQVFLGHFLALKNEELASAEKQLESLEAKEEKTDNSPCISPLDML